MIDNLNIANSNRKDTNIKFTKDQEIAVHELIEFLAQPWDEKKYINALCGAGGTGKTFVIKYVIIIMHYLKEKQNGQRMREINNIMHSNYHLHIGSNSDFMVKVQKE